MSHYPLENKKGQVFVEALFGIAVVIFLFSIALFIYYSNSSDLTAIQTSFEGRRQCFLVSSAINSVQANGAGTEIYLNLPSYINSQNYTVNLYSIQRLVDISWGNNTVFDCGVYAANVTNGTSGSFSVLKGTNSIKNVGDGVVIQNV